MVEETPEVVEQQEGGSMGKYIIKDWAGNHLFKDEEFDSYEDGWDFLYNAFPYVDDDDDRTLEEYYVVPIK